MRRIVLLALVSLLPACAPGDGPDMAAGFGDSAVHVPESDGYTMQRILGQPESVPPLVEESGNVWPRNLTARPNNAMEDAGRDRMPAPRRGSSRAPGGSVDPYVLHPPTVTTSPAAIAAPPPTPHVGRPVIVPGSPVPGVTTGGTNGYQTYQVPGGGAGVIVPGGANTNIVTTPDGRVTTVPR